MPCSRPRPRQDTSPGRTPASPKLRCRPLPRGLATAAGYELTQSILWDLLDDFVLVDDLEILRAIAILVEKTHTLAEGAGAAALAGAIKYGDKIADKKVALIISGGNITLPQLREAMEMYQPSD